jgi:ribosomal protein S18 acetylase RimI-like enzyme
MRRATVRRATRADLPAVVDCLRGAFAPYRDAYTPEAFDDTVPQEAALARRFETMSLFVGADGDGEVAGTIAVAVAHGGQAHIRGMSVRPARQGSGLADALLGAAEMEAQRLGCRRVTLDTTAPLQRAIAFYEKRGYRRTGRVTDFFGMPLHEYARSLETPRVPPLRAAIAGLCGGLAWIAGLFLFFGPAQAILTDPERQSAKFLQAFAPGDSAPRLLTSPAQVVAGILAIGVAWGFAFALVARSWRGAWWSRGLKFGALGWVLMVPWFEFYLPWNVMLEPWPLVLVEATCWAAVLLTVGLTIAGVEQLLRAVIQPARVVSAEVP